MVEVNPPLLPDMTHMALHGRWNRVLITDNPFKQVRVSPYAFAARITHDVPEVIPTVVCSTRDRNILAIESEVRGAIGNGVNSFLVVQGDMLPEVEHWSNSYEIVEYLRELERSLPTVQFEVGMSSRSRRWMIRRRVETGAQFLTVGPVMDPEAVRPLLERLDLRDGDPPVYLEITPPVLGPMGAPPGFGWRRPPGRCPARAVGAAERRGAPRRGVASGPGRGERGTGAWLRRNRAHGPPLRNGGR